MASAQRRACGKHLTIPQADLRRTRADPKCRDACGYELHRDTPQGAGTHHEARVRGVRVRPAWTRAPPGPSWAPGHALHLARCYPLPEVYALTPGVILGAVLPLVRVEVPMFWLIYLAISVAYAILGAQRASATPPPSNNSAAL